MKHLLLGAIGAYRRWISPLLPRSCRYEPTCSSYAAEAIATHGALRGGWMAMKRIARCHPWAEGGFDPVKPPSGAGHGHAPRQRSA